jgi:hypothetical protein
MKKIIYTIVLISLVVIAACSRNSNGALPEGIVYLNQPHITKVSGSAAILDTEPEAFTAKIKVDLYFKDSDKPEKADLVVVKNGDVKNAKVIKEGITTFPTEVDINGQLLTNLFGTIVSGDNFDFGLDMYVGGEKYAAFSTTGNSYGSGVTSGQANASPTVRYSSICGFAIDQFVGTYEVITDPWGDFGEGEEVIVKKVNDNTLAIEHIAPDFEDLVVEINDLDNSAKIASKMIATEAAVAGYYGGGGAYGSLTIATAGATSLNFVDPCTKTITLNIQYTLSKYGNQGAYAFVIKKK